VDLGPGGWGKKFASSPTKGRPPKNIYTKSERLNLSCRVTWAWSVRINLYNRQVIVLSRNTKTCAM